MIEHVWSVVCAKTATDRQTNTISLFEVIEQINANFPRRLSSAAGRRGSFVFQTHVCDTSGNVQAILALD